MKVRLFEFSKDYERLSKWYEAWGYLPIPPEILPRHGLIVSNYDQEIGAAWLYITDGNVALIEGAVLNPAAPKKYRIGIHAFLNNALQQLAKELGCRQIWALSKDKFSTKICQELGFQALQKDFKVLIKEI